jgi:hypothetical protein
MEFILRLSDRQISQGNVGVDSKCWWDEAQGISYANIPLGVGGWIMFVLISRNAR